NPSIALPTRPGAREGVDIRASDSRQRTSQIGAYRWPPLRFPVCLIPSVRTCSRGRTIRGTHVWLWKYEPRDLDRRSLDAVLSRILRIPRRTPNRTTRGRPPLPRIPAGPMGHQTSARRRRSEERRVGKAVRPWVGALDAETLS